MVKSKLQEVLHVPLSLHVQTGEYYTCPSLYTFRQVSITRAPLFTRSDRWVLHVPLSLHVQTGEYYTCPSLHTFRQVNITRASLFTRSDRWVLHVPLSLHVQTGEYYTCPSLCTFRQVSITRALLLTHSNRCTHNAFPLLMAWPTVQVLLTIHCCDKGSYLDLFGTVLTVLVPFIQTSIMTNARCSNDQLDKITLLLNQLQVYTWSNLQDLFLNLWWYFKLHYHLKTKHILILLYLAQFENGNITAITKISIQI